MTTSRLQLVRIGGPAPRLAAFLAALVAASGAAAGNKNWNNDNGNWNTAGNWSPRGVPAVGDFVWIGNLAAAENGWVNLNASPIIAGLTITDGMTLDTNTSPLVVQGDTTISGSNATEFVTYSSSIYVDQGPAPFDFQTSDLTISDDGHFRIANGATAYVTDVFTLSESATLFGGGTLRLAGNGAVALKINGSLQAEPEGFLILQIGTAPLDLDGDVAGDHGLNVTSSMNDGTDFAWLTVQCNALSDTLDEDLSIGSFNVVTMTIAEGWSMGPNAELFFVGSPDFPGPAQLNGSELTMHGAIHVGGAVAHGQVNAPIVLEPTAGATVGPDDLLEFNSTTTVHGGVFVLDDGGDLDFDGPTFVEGGTFITFSEFASDGSVDFNGDTTWNGDVECAGIARQVGDASVAGTTAIDAQAFDMDGSGTTQWTLSSGLTINAEHIDGTSSNTFDGTIVIPSVLLGKLTINLEDADEYWNMAGHMNLSGLGVLTPTRIAGSEMRVTGTIDVSGRIVVTAPTFFLNASDTSFANALSSIRFTNKSTVSSSATFNGDGALETSSTGELTLLHGVSLGGVGVKNAGTMKVGQLIGSASVDRFENTAGATLSVDIGGTQPGTTHDVLVVSEGGTTLAGSLKVNVVDSGDGLFAPQIGDSFTVLEADGPIVGGFTNAPISFVPGMAYLWSVSTQGNFVIVSLVGTIPCPADLDGDGAVGASDLAILLGAWGTSSSADLDGSGNVDSADLAILLGEWGGCV